MATKQTSKRMGVRPKALKQDDSIMGTNNSSIVSKRSVERLYYPHEPHFFRYFVKKPLRRAPLINRGYWLRMKAIDTVVRQFLEEPSSKPKVVINLGAGYDPLPWQCLTRYPAACKDVKFIDIDYRDLQLRKRETIMATPELQKFFSNVSCSESEILFKSDQYLQIGCDLRETSQLAKILSTVVDLDESLILFTAEVSITYMTVEGADKLIKFAGSLPDARFCLLEQLLPQGRDHPFAKTMMAHFDKLQTSLHSVPKYPTTKHQEQRFRDAGWASAKAQNLWELWASESFLSLEEREAVDAVEPFDEWEEFALFGCHYLLLIADSSKAFGDHETTISDMLKSEISSSGVVLPIQKPETPRSHSPLSEASETDSRHVKSSCQRRFGSVLAMRSTDSRKDLVGNFGGMGQTRLNSIDVYTPDTPLVAHNFRDSSSVPSPRMCHTLTDMGDMGALLVGGRSSPDNAFADCWLYYKWTNIWERVEDLPVPSFRHSAVHLGDGRVLVMGGKSSSRTYLKNAWLWSRRTGWTRCTSEMPTDTSTFPQRFGAMLFLGGKSSHQGLFFGGISRKGLVCQDSWIWKLTFVDNEDPLLRFESCDLSSVLPDSTLARFGATIATENDQAVVIGGITADYLLPWEREILLLQFKGSRLSTLIDGTYSSLSSDMHIRVRAVHLPRADNVSRPLLVGSSAALIDDELLVIGGGAVCFSMGTFWTEGAYVVSISTSFGYRAPEPQQWQYLKTMDTSAAESTSKITSTKNRGSGVTAPLVTVPRRTIGSPEDFQKVTISGQPLIIEKLNLGTCQQVWTDDYLKERVGPEREVVVHESSSDQMDFLEKNFKYAKKPFAAFMDAINAGERLYLRSLSADKPSEEPANIAKDYPTIAKDFELPRELNTAAINAHSSPLRISGPVNMWLHYDVMANVLCQIRGSKKLLLFPPTDVAFLGFTPGNSSSSIDVFTLLEAGELGACHPHEVTLNPGDVLFLPPLWLHTAKPLDGVSISVNVFFRNLEKGYAAGRDVYGNRDLQAYEKGRQDIAKIARAFAGVSDDMREFYLIRLAEELQGLKSASHS